MTTLNYISVSLNLFCIAISSIIYLCLFLEKTRQSKINRLFRLFVLCNFGIVGTDTVAWLTNGRTEAYAYYLVRVSNYMHYLFGGLVLVTLTTYMLANINLKVKTPRRIAYIAFSIAALSILMTTLSLFTNMYYIIDENNMYNRQDWYLLSQLFPALGLIFNIGIIILYRKYLKFRNILFFTIYMIMPILSMIIQAIFYGITLNNVATTLIVLLLYIGVQMEQAKNTEIELTESKLMIMISQIKPHFLYNTLTTIENLCYKDGEKAARLVRNFAVYLRENMNALKQKDLVSFDHEIRHTRVYLDIEKQRFEERLNVVYDFDINYFKMPVLTLQPLVENAVRHGVAKKKSGGTVTIATRPMPEGIKIIISDDGVGFDPNQSTRRGVGIENVRERLYTQCGGALTVESAKDSGTVCTITIPWTWEE